MILEIPHYQELKLGSLETDMPYVWVRPNGWLPHITDVRPDNLWDPEKAAYLLPLGKCVYVDGADWWLRLIFREDRVHVMRGQSGRTEVRREISVPKKSVYHHLLD